MKYEFTQVNPFEISNRQKFKLSLGLIIAATTIIAFGIFIGISYLVPILIEFHDYVKHIKFFS